MCILTLTFLLTLSDASLITHSMIEQQCVNGRNVTNYKCVLHLHACVREWYSVIGIMHSVENVTDTINRDHYRNKGGRRDKGEDREDHRGKQDAGDGAFRGSMHGVGTATGNDSGSEEGDGEEDVSDEEDDRGHERDGSENCTAAAACRHDRDGNVGGAMGWKGEHEDS